MQIVEKYYLKRAWERGFQPQPCTCKSHPLRCRKSGQRSLECNVAGGPGCEAWIGPVHKLTLYPRRSLVLALHKHRLHHQGGRINLFFSPMAELKVDYQTMDIKSTEIKEVTSSAWLRLYIHSKLKPNISPKCNSIKVRNKIDLTTILMLFPFWCSSGSSSQSNKSR